MILFWLRAPSNCSLRSDLLIVVGLKNVNFEVRCERYAQLTDIVLELELALREQAFWEAQPPSVEALMSQQPFYFDTLRFSQWLQFVFVERLRMVIDSCGALPARSGNGNGNGRKNFKGIPCDARRIIGVLA